MAWLTQPWPGGAVGIAFGLAVFAAIGSLLGAAAARLAAAIEGRTTYRGRSFWSGRSICPSCGNTIAASDLVPVLSWLRLHGRCRLCRASIPADYALIEAGAMLAFLIALASQPMAGRVLAVGLLGAVLTALTMVDLRHQLLPDALTLPLIPLGLAAAALDGPGSWAMPVDCLIGGAFGAGLIGIVRWLHLKLRGIEGIGLGDVKLMAVAGAWVGWQGIGTVLLLAAFGTLAAVALARVLGRSIEITQRIPFGPGLAAGCFVTVIAGPVGFGG